MQEVQNVFLKSHELESITGKIEEEGLNKAEEHVEEQIRKIISKS